MPFGFDAAVAAPFRMQPGLRRVADGQPQLTPLSLSSRHLAAKLAVLMSDADNALLVAPGVDPRPALRTLMAEAARVDPAGFDWDGADAFTARRIGWGLRGDEVQGDGPGALGDCLRQVAPPMRAAALLSLAFEEDLAGIDAAGARISWLAVCLPSHWSPAQKIGCSFAEVHAPVPDAAVLRAAGDHLMRLVASGERWERFVWSVTPRSALDAHPRRSLPVDWPEGCDPSALAAAAWFRTEHQTFLPVTDAPAQAVFTIRVEVRPLAEAIASAAQAQRLHAALASMSVAVLAYRGLASARDRLLAWLAHRAA